MLFAKKKQAATTVRPEHEPETDELKSVTENLYKQNLELAVKNKTLSILGKLYEISIQTLSSKELAQEITSSIQEAFEFERVGILVYDNPTDVLTVLAFSESERFHKARASANEFFDTTVLRAVSKSSFFGPIISSKKMGYTEQLQDVWGQGIDPAEIQKIQTEGHVRSVLAYPLVIQDSVMGFFVLTLNRVYADLVEYEKESIQSFINVIAVALDKARLYEELETANKQQVVLIHFITHQIKGFLTKSRNIFSMALDGDFGVLPESFLPMAQEGLRSDTQGVDTVQEILNASNVKSGAVKYTMEPFDLGALVDEVVTGLKPNADKKSLALTVDEGPGPIMFTGDKMQLQNAFKNLIDNSIKYTPSGTVAVSLKEENGKMRFMIQDTGVGITPEDMAHLFTEGGHGKESIKVNVESTGFGLYIVKNIVEAHHGKVWAESEGAGKGSRFIVELPLSAPVSQ